jgi:hypothetical protein
MNKHIDIFKNVYETCLWGNNNDPLYRGSSGHGSSIEINLPYIRALQNIIRNSSTEGPGQIRRIVDLGCGDWRCGRTIYDDLMNDSNLNIEYIGYDAYIGVVNANREKYPDYNFENIDIYNNREKLMDGDMCILKDVVQHWSNAEITTMLRYLYDSKKYKYILLCNSANQTRDIEDIRTGDFREISSKKYPLNQFPLVSLFYYPPTKEVCIIPTSADLPIPPWQ